MPRTSSLRASLRRWVPPALEPTARSLVGAVKFRGDFASWQDAAGRCEGYSSGVILDRVRDGALRAKRGEVAYEQDAVVFETRSYVWPMLANLLFIAGKHEQNLHVLDFGGSLGSNYYRHLPYLERLRSVKWSIVEQPHYVQLGQREFEDDRLRFFEDIESCLAWSRPDVVLLSGVLQYLPEPHAFLAGLRAHGIDFLMLDRTPFVERASDRLCLQHVGEPHYPAVYPAWFFSRARLVDDFEPAYQLLEEFETGDHANIPSEYRGLLFERRLKADAAKAE